eukprot:gb/GECG01005010.1/.p1 GENE.gb/GECG01005010.1/~~gb/GECG01005010.1/.p1  ORF type:complete len:515 (+),score=60.13 gb/GECG01005010.1/:1-1545(+)
MRSSLILAYIALQGALLASASRGIDAPPSNSVRGSKQKGKDASGTQYVYAKLPNGDGIVQGIELPEENAKFWKGIPYAASTGGENRFRPPQRRAPWNGVFNATTFGPGCPQTHHNADVPKVQSEDCLNLNVYTPASAPPANGWPVMIFFHGGGFQEGSNQGPFGIYEGNYMSSHGDVVVVTSNYRLGAYGFIVTEELPGNQGFLDQQMALKWVRDNIGVFGGNHSRVTVWGESAGAMSVGFHMVSPSSKGLFHQGLMESNPSGFVYKNEEEAAYYGLKVCSVLQCCETSDRAKRIDGNKNGLHPSSAPDALRHLFAKSALEDSEYLTKEELQIVVAESKCNLKCMQNATIKDVNNAWKKAGGDVWTFIEANWRHLLDGFLQFTPTIDGKVIPQEPLKAVEEGNFTDVPLLLGTNRNEGSTFIYAAIENPLPSFLAPIFYDVVFGIDNSKRISARPRYAPNTTDDARVIISQTLTVCRCLSATHACILFQKLLFSRTTFSDVLLKNSLPHWSVKA